MDIRRLRTELELTQHEAAAVIYSTRDGWDKWERGDRRMHPALWELFRLKVNDIELTEVQK